MFPSPNRLLQWHNAKVGKPRQFSASQIRPIPVDKQGRPETHTRGLTPTTAPVFQGMPALDKLSHLLQTTQLRSRNRV